MSHWQAGKLNMKCSINVLKKALINIMPEWENHIKVSEEGQINLYTYTGNSDNSGGYHIMVPGQGNPNHAQAPKVVYNDIGFKQNADKSWDILVDPHGLGISDFKGTVMQEVATMRAKAIAEVKKFTIKSDSEENGERVLCMRVPEEEVSKYSV